MEKRVIAFLILSFLIIVFYPFFLRKFVKTPEPQRKTIEKTAETVPGLIAPALKKEEISQEEQQILVDTDLYQAVFSTRGGTLLSWKLKNYTEQAQKNADGLGTDEINLVPKSKEGFTLPLAIRQEGALAQPFYRVETKNLPLQEGKDEGSIRFTYQDGAKRIVKEFTVHRSTYRAGITIETAGFPDGYILDLGTNVGIHTWAESFGGLVGPITRVDSEKQSLNPVKMKPVVTRTGKVSWIAQQDKYFLAALLPTEPLEASVDVRRTGEKEVDSGIKISGGEALKPQSFEVYIGPKDFSRLQALHRNLEETVDFGWFIFGSWWLVRMIAKPLFYILMFFYSFSHNYGVAIILVTCIVKAAFFPISLRAMRSMAAMQQIQPKLTALKKKYEKDREKLNREMMELYKAHNVNPLGGCLPMLVQLPVFVALFNVLYVSIEMRHAPFVFWIKDLSSFDHLYILPLIYGATTYLLQKMQPPGMDPQQAQMIAIIIPIVTTVLFLNFPSGLVLYWVVNNLLSIGQQHLIGPRRA